MTALKLFLFSAMIAMGGLPLYVHLPQYVGAQLGISLTILGGVLLALRLIDMVQDPLLGRLLDRFPDRLPSISLVAALCMAFGGLGVFVIRMQTGTVAWLFISAFFLFSGYSLLYILLYRQSSALQETTMPNAARIREIGLLIGVLVGSVLPFIFGSLGFDPYSTYGISLAIICVAATIFAIDLWRFQVPETIQITWANLRKIGAHKVLVLIFFNSLPTAITSTLFLFFVSDKLLMPTYSGAFLFLFFFATVFGVIITSSLAKTIDSRKLLMWSMGGAIFSFLWAFFLPAGAVVGFSVICILSGMFLGTELYLLPVMFSKLLTSNNLQTGSAFGIWSFLSKLGLALAAAIILPALSAADYRIGEVNSTNALMTLAASYALLPSLLKLGALALTTTLPKGVIVQ